MSHRHFGAKWLATEYKRRDRRFRVSRTPDAMKRSSLKIQEIANRKAYSSSFHGGVECPLVLAISDEFPEMIWKVARSRS
jgi:hypothetical protein